MSAALFLRQLAAKRPSTRYAHDRLAQTLAGIALAVWVCGRLVLVHSDVGTLPFVAAVQPMAFVEAAVFGCAVAAICMQEIRMDAIGFVALGLLIAAAFAVRVRLKDPSLLVFALLLAASRGMSFSRLALFGLAGIAGALLFIAVLRFFPAQLANANHHALAKLHFEGRQMVPRLAFESLACLFLVLQERRSWAPLGALLARRRGGESAREPMMPSYLLNAALMLGCALCAAVSVVRYDAQQYALLMLLLGTCVVAHAVWQDKLDAVSTHPWTRLVMAAIPPVLCCVVCDFVAFYRLAFMDVNTGAYVSFTQSYGLLPLLPIMLLYVRSIFTSDEKTVGFPLWAVFILYALALAFDANAMFVEINLPLLFLSAGLGTIGRGNRAHG